MPIFRIAETRKYPKRWRKIVLHLAHISPRRATVHELVNVLYGDDPDGGPEWAVEIVRCAFCTYRDRLPKGWQVVSRKNSGGYGYAICPVREGKR